MANILTSKTEQEKKDQVLVKKIRPKLRKFVVNEQRKAAAQAASETKKEAEKLLSNDDIIKTASQLACRAFLEYRFWEKQPLPVDLAWTRGRTLDGKPLSVAEMQAEMNTDISGFASYLVREYHYMKGSISAGSYPNPLLEKDLPFFWQKFAADLRLLFDTDRRLKNLGNQGVVLVGDPYKK